MTTRPDTIADAAQAYRNCWDEHWLNAQPHGIRRAAEAAWYPGHPLGSVEAIEARMKEMQERARRTRAA